jgi:coenzyme Q-binding protein COQ10
VVQRGVTMYYNRSFLSFRKPLEHVEKRLVGYSQKQMYDIVSQVEHYPLFVPWCRGSKILKREGPQYFAELNIGFNGLSERYTSIVTCESPALVHATASQTSLFEHLESEWKILKAGDFCMIDFRVSCLFKSLIYTNLASQFFPSLASQMANAFEKRALQLHGLPFKHKV